MEKKINEYNTLLAVGNDIKYAGHTIDYNDLLDMTVVNKLKKHANDFNFDTVYVNELYRDYFLPYVCIENYLLGKSIVTIDVSAAEERLQAILSDYAVRNNIHLIGNGDRTFNLLKYSAYVYGTAIYLGIKQFKNRRCDLINKNTKQISICRTPASQKKIQKVFCDNILAESAPGVGNVYCQLSLWERFSCLVKAVRQQKEELKKVKGQLLNNGYKCIYYSLLAHYKSRAVHTFFYENVANQIIRTNNFDTFITGNNLDRFAMLEEFIAKENNLKLVCIPHGIEYGYKFPKCFVGDVFFTMSQNAASCLNELYDTDKFVFDNNLENMIFRVAGKEYEKSPKIIYFSEPREPEVNIKILKELLEIFEKNGTQLYIKHHPKDVKSDYDVFKGKIEEINNLDEAICGNICLSRKSTTLLEGVYNDSKCAAIITNAKDECIFYTFPSLQDERIATFHSISDAAEWALNCYRKQSGTKNIENA